MKFLCVPCDEPMTLEQTSPPDNGSIALTYSCPACGYEMAMMTNAHETQLVGSLGVKIGASSEDRGNGEGEVAAKPAGASKCPFTGVVQQMQAEPAAADGFRWTDDAEKRLAALPDFIRPMAKSGIEKWAREKGFAQVDATVLDQAKDFFGM